MTGKRIDFFKALLIDLEDTYNELNKVSEDISGISSKHLEQYNFINKENRNSEVNKLRTNIEKIKEYNNHITDEINRWYIFTNDPQEIIKLTFPLKFYFRRLKLRKEIAVTNKQISKIFIENRLIKETLKKMERMIEANTLEQIKNSGMYKEYEALLQKKEERLSDLRYLLPTIPSLPKELDLNNISNIYVNL
ncbi:MAG: hypothetical protein JM58_14875 [Peptococcaceae bacterium BICA1-8]|nr:MAG: hypothetical protein JM58_14875 [Peptococcaceae bacterium BICA1-8]